MVTVPFSVIDHPRNVSGITPFTYRDGTTYLEILNGLVDHLNNKLGPEIGSRLEVIHTAAVDAAKELENGYLGQVAKLEEFRAGINETLRLHRQELGDEYDIFTNLVNRTVDGINNRAGAVDVQHVTLDADKTLTLDPAWPSNQPVRFTVTQDSTGGKKLALPSGVAGSPVINPEPEAVTRFTLYPDNGSWVAYLDHDEYRVEDFYRIGDGSDWAPAFKRAITVANGRPIALNRPEYIINSEISFTGKNVSMFSRNSAGSVIRALSQRFGPLRFEYDRSTEIVRYLASSKQINTHGWIVNNGEGVRPGMFARVMSSASWYYDPRADSTDCRKSELHRVVRVDGNTIYFEDPSNDGYDITAETVEIKFYAPISVNLSNITVKATLEGYSDNARRVNGVSLVGAYEPQLINVSVEDCANAGIQMNECYRPNVDGGHTFNANNYYSGYGVQTWGCAWARVADRRITGSRRGVDFSGGNIISRQNLAENCVVYGGGVASTGQAYGWERNGATGSANFGFGTHGGADHTTYLNCTTANVHMAYSLRASNERIIGAKHYGRTRTGVVGAITGNGLEISNFQVIVDQIGADKNTTIYEGGANINTRRPDSFLRVYGGYSKNSVIRISDVFAEVQDRFVHFESGMTEFKYFSLANARVICATQSGDSPAAVLWHDGPLSTVSPRWSIGPVDYAREGGSAGISMTRNINLAGAKVLYYTNSAATN